MRHRCPSWWKHRWVSIPGFPGGFSTTSRTHVFALKGHLCFEGFPPCHVAMEHEEPEGVSRKMTSFRSPKGEVPHFSGRGVSFWVGDPKRFQDLLPTPDKARLSGAGAS